MTRRQAIEEFVKRDFQGLPTEWIRVLMEHFGDVHALPMWGHMWIVSDGLGKQLEGLSLVESWDEEMKGEMRVADTAMFLYYIDNRYVVGIHGAGWDFFDGVWDVVCDALGMRWHDEDVE